MKQWILHHKKLSYSLLAAIIIIVLLVRLFVVPERLPTSQNQDWESISRSVLAGGMPTGAVGQLVVVDLSLLLTANDQMGHYACTFDVVLETS